jgi:hypothetical protein
LLLDRTTRVDQLRHIDEAVRKRRLAVVYVGNDAKVPCIP